MPSFDVQEAAAFLGVTPSRIYQLKNRKARDKLAFTSGSVSLEVLLAHPAADRRLKAVAAVLESIGTPAVAASELGTILGLNAAAARMLYRSSSDLCGYSVIDIGLPLDAPRGTHARLTRGQWDVGAREVTRIKKSLSQAQSLYTNIRPDQYGDRLVQMLASVHRLRSGHWAPVVESMRYPILGGGHCDVFVRTINLDVSSGNLLIHLLEGEGIRERIERDAVSVRAGISEQPRTFLYGLLLEYARLIATECCAEACSIFLFDRPLDLNRTDPELVSEPEGILVPVGYYGLPELTMQGEVFSPVGPMPGLVAEVVKQGALRFIDPGDSALEGVIRQPNLFNASLASRFGDIHNGIVMPIQIGSGDRSRAVGALRLLNFFTPAPSGIFLPRDPKNDVFALNSITSGIARVYEALQTVTCRELIRRAIRTIPHRWSPQLYCEQVARQILQGFGFGHVVIWKATRRDALEPWLYVGCGEAQDFRIEHPGALARPLFSGETHKLRVLGWDAPTDELARGAREGLRIFNGWEFPIVSIEGSIWGTLGCYNSWVTDNEARVAREAFEVCSDVAGLLGVQVER